MDVMFLSSSSSCLAAAGYGGVQLWDTNQPSNRGAAQRFAIGRGVVTRVGALPGGYHLVGGHE